MTNNYSYLLLAILANENCYIEVSNRIKSFTVINDCASYMFPIAYINILLSVEEYRQIDKDSTILRLSCRKYTVSTNNIISNIYATLFKNLEFSIIDRNYSYIQSNSEMTTSSNTEEANLLNVRFTLLLKEDLDGASKGLMGNFIETDLQKMIYYLVDSIGGEKKTILETPDNTKIYKQIIIPYNTPYRTLKYLDTVYGVYESGMKTYFDFTKNYILNNSASKLNSEKKNIVIEVKNVSNLLNDTQNLDNRIIVDSNAINYTVSTSRTQYLGDNNSFVLSDSNKTILSQNNQNASKTKVYYQQYSNPYTSNILNNSENNTIVRVNIYNSDYEYFNFLNTFTINDELNKFKGVIFNANTYINTFTLTTSRYFNLYTTLSLKKI